MYYNVIAYYNYKPSLLNFKFSGDSIVNVKLGKAEKMKSEKNEKRPKNQRKIDVCEFHV